MHRRALAFALAASIAPVLAAASPAWGHALITDPPHRAIETDGAQAGDADIKDQDCEGTPSATPVELVAGATFVVKWKETIEHPGHYKILFSKTPTDPASFTILVDNIPDVEGALPAGGRSYEMAITVPNDPCEGCVLQLQQFMSESNTSYYSCGDVRIVAAAADGGADDAGADSDGGTGGMDGGVGGNADAGGTPATDDTGAPGLCSVGGRSASSPASGTMFALFVAASLLARRRFRSR